MSVICQNFVQNAWKKDLCSNCFKSVGDHDISESELSDATQNSNQSESLSIRYISQSSSNCTSHSNSAPHTTWKSLISERNTKNSQPFKLETGFQGRLLTINKATHGIEKKDAKAKLTNGDLSDTQMSSSDDMKGSTNGHTTKKNSEVSHFKKNTNGYSVQNRNNCHRNINTKIVNGVKLKNNEIKKEARSLNGQNLKESTKTTISDDESSSLENKRISPARLVKSKSEDLLPCPLHSILKKTVSSPVNQSRRGSNVGFKDEEPLVIGYGGRDFSPEELEWEMNTSDSEIESTSDETEDDKAFSKITKMNTEFNSDNTNLLQNNVDIKNTNTQERSEGNSNQKDSSIVPKSSRTSEILNKAMGNKSKNENTFERNKENANGQSDLEMEEKMNNDSTKEKGGNVNEDKLNSQTQDGKHTKKDGELANQNTEGNDITSVPIKGDKINPVVSSGGVTVVETTKGGESSDAKNSSEFAHDLASSNVIPTQNTSRATRAGEESPVMYSDGEGRGETENTDPLPDENNEWQGDDGMAGQILQAINTSLTNRHKINDNKDTEKYNKEQMNTDSNLIPNKCNEESKAMDDTKVEISISSTAEISSDNSVENLKIMEPRTSFLHGITSNDRPVKPHAIYGPASDLFVSRSDSSSSSSSDELGREQMAHSINVIVNGKNNTQMNRNISVNESENDDARFQNNYSSEQKNNSTVTFKTKPKLPMKPLKPAAKPPLKQTQSLDVSQSSRLDSGTLDNGSYYSVSNASIYSEGPKSITLVDHYAESNIYHEVDNEEIKQDESEQSEKVVPRESKLAALAMELEQVRHSNGNIKRQAPAPPKIPEPPLEDPPNCTGRTSPMVGDGPIGFSSFRGEALAFSSSSSTTSTSSQDTETGYASWNLHGDDQRKQSKSKSSFLLTQYSKCKMLAMGYAEDSARSRKKFSLKKLLKMKKEGESSAAFDPSSPNPKAWKYSDHFERPRAKLEIIHPMDLENKSLTVNPGFDSLHSGSMSSFSASADDLSLRNSVSSDYGSFYSDTMSPMQDVKSEVNYECLQSRNPTSENEDLEERNASGNSNSPTPSRTSLVSQASTLTSGSSKNGGASPHRPPKPPPPPRAHSLLPGNKTLNPDGTFKFPIVNCNSVNNVEVSVLPTKPQAPKRQCKSMPQRIECGIYDNNLGLVSTAEADNPPSKEMDENEDSSPVIENTFGTVLDIGNDSPESCNSKTMLETNIPDPPKLVEEHEENQTTILEVKPEPQTINVTMKTNITDPNKRLSKSILTCNKPSPVTKAPARPPPIYMKPQISSIVKNPNPWKSLEDSYLVLTASNRELLVKLVNQALKRRKLFLTKLQTVKFQWSDFEIDGTEPSAVFAFGEKIAYHATMPQHAEYLITLVVSVQQQHNRMSENNELKYPVFGQFLDHIPRELLENASDSELESMQATVLVLNRSNISTIECFSENLPNSLATENEKELCFIVLQLIHSLKSLQAQGIESIEPSFQNLILAKSKQDKYNTLIFLYDSCYEENDYVSDSCKISLCQYALMLLFQMLGIQTLEEFELVSSEKFSSEMAKKVFEGAINLFLEEKAVSLSQTKTLLECFLWDVTRVIESFDESDDIDSVLHRWFDIKRVGFIKSIIDEENLYDINVQSEHYSQFLLRTSVRNIKEVLLYL